MNNARMCDDHIDKYINVMNNARMCDDHIDKYRFIQRRRRIIENRFRIMLITLGYQRSCWSETWKLSDRLHHACRATLVETFGECCQCVSDDLRAQSCGSSQDFEGF